MRSEVSHVLFDLGNTVFRFNFDKCLHIWARKAGKSEEKIKESFLLDDAHLSLEQGDMSGAEYYRHVCTMLDVSISYDDFLGGWISIFGPVIPETIEFLKEASSKLNLYAFTNTNGLHQAEWSKKYVEELKFFKHIFCSHEIRMRKPDPAAFDLILKELKVDVRQTVLVDDILENVEGARSVGMHAVHFQNPKDSIQELRQIL